MVKGMITDQNKILAAAICFAGFKLQNKNEYRKITVRDFCCQLLECYYTFVVSLPCAADY